MRLRSRFGWVSILTLAMGLVTPLTADAAFTMRLQTWYTNSNGVWTEYDRTFSDDYFDGRNDGRIDFTQFGLGDFLLQGSFGTSNAPYGSPATLTLDQVSIRNLETQRDRTLIITVQDTGFMLPSNGDVRVDTALETQMTNYTGSDVRMTSYLGSTPAGEVYRTTSGVSSTSAIRNISGTPYTLRSVTTVRLGAAGVLMSEGSTTVSSLNPVSPVPAPATAVMALAGVPILGAFGWLRRRKVSRPTAA